MKKTSVIIALLLIFSVGTLGVVSAKTLIAGKIYNADFSETVSGAYVEINCNSNIKNTTSINNGTYSATYNETGLGSCKAEDSLSVYASHPSYGFNTVSGVIHKNMTETWDVGIVNVNLVPEFGFYMAILTVLASAGIFFFVRRG